MDPTLVLVKQANRQYAVEGDIITYSVTANNQGSTNPGNIPLDNVIISDLLPSSLEFILGTVTLDGILMPQGSILSGINIGSLAVDQIKTITFQAKVLSGTVTPIENTITGQFNYQLPGGAIQNGRSTSNLYSVAILNPHLNVVKTASSQETMMGDTITYTVTITNDGNLIAYSVLFTDTLPNEVTLVPGSFTIDGKVVNTLDLTKGIMIASIAVGQTVTIQYQVKVIGSNCRGFIVNQVAVTFTYRLPDGTMPTITVQEAESTTETFLTITTFKQMSVETYCTIPTVKPDIEGVNGITASVDISNYNIIETPVAISMESQNLTGYKLIVSGRVNVVIEYTALELTQSVHSAHYSVPFSVFIILPPNYSIGSKLEVDGLVEDVYYNLIDTRNFFTNVTLLINTKIFSC